MKCPDCGTFNPHDSKYCKECAASLLTAEESQASLTKTMAAAIHGFIRGALFANRYEVIEELGRGGIGRVFRVEDKKTKEEIALKLLKPEISTDQDTIERFRKELTMARKIRHKNICAMYDLGEDEGTHYITMEYVRGEDLRRLIKRVKHLPSDTALSIAKQVCEGLAEAHRLGIIHRDLKPSNIMIDKEGNARIMDFGIARSLKDEEITGTGVLIGTPKYMSPEQADGKKVDHRSDIYSLGVILHEMLTGKVPIKGDTARLRARAPQRLCHVIQGCLEENIDKRYKSAKALLSELDNVDKIATESSRTAKTIQHHSIAVLPFVDLSPQQDQAYFCAGLAEELLLSLSKIEGLQVAARTSSFRFDSRDYDIFEIGEKLKVSTVLEGSVRKAGNRVRITVQHVKASDGYHLWSERYDRDLEDIFAIQDEISLAIVDALKLKLLGKEKQKLMKRSTDNLEAFNLYLKGRHFWARRFEGGLQKSMEYFQQAAEKDDGYAPAYVGIADALSILGTYGFLRPHDVFPRAKAAANRALELDAVLPEVHTSLGYIGSFYDLSWDEAEKEFGRAIKHNPNDSLSRLWYALHLMAVGRIEEGLEEAERGQALDPFSPIINSLVGLSYIWNRRYDEAVEQLRRTVEIDPNFLLAHIWLSNAYGMSARYEQALEEIEKALAAEIDMPYALGHLGWTYGMLGKEQEALDVFNRLMKMSETRFISPWPLAFTYLGIKNIDQAVTYFERAYSERDPIFAMTCTGPWYASLGSDPRYVALLEKMGLKIT
jgi:serine/threonine-protein kinase